MRILSARLPRALAAWGLIGLLSLFGSTARAQDLFVTSFVRNHPVERFNGTTGAYVSSLDPENDLSDTAGTPGYAYRYTGLTFDPSGSIYFSNFVDRSQPPYKDDGVDRYNVATGKFEVYSTFGASDPYGLVFGGQNRNLFVATKFAQGSPGVYGGILQYFKGFGNYTLDFNFFSQVTDPYDITFGPDNNIYVSSSSPGTIERYDGSTGAYLGVFAHVNTPVGLTFGPDGKLYVSSYGGNAVQRYDGKTGAFIDNFAVVNNPTGLTFGPDGNLYVASWASNTVEHFSGTTGTSLGTFASSGLDHPFGVAFAPAGVGTNFPRVSLTSPHNNDIFSAPGTISLTASASDSYGTITKVEFYSGATKIGEATTSPYTVTWPNVATGTYTLTAKATNDGGAVATSSPISVTVFTPVSSLKINCGDGDYTSATTGLWQADTDFTGGSTYTYPQSSVVGTNDPSLYDSVRYSDTAFGYRLPVGPGTYTVTLYFMEGDRNGTNQRLFNVTLNGSQVLTNFDVYKEAGGQGIALAKSFPVTVGANGIPIDFQAYANNAMVSAIEVEPVGPPTLPPSPTNLAAVAGDKQVSLSWTASSGAASYNVYRGTAAGGEAATPIKTGVTGTTYTDTGLTNGTAYYYKVTAVNSAGESTPSNEASATPAAAQAAALQINCGGGDYTSATTGLWQADTDFTGGSTYTFPTAVSGTSDPSLFQSVRYDATAFSYQLPVPAGAYTLKLYFVEGDRTAAGQRVFNVSVNGSQVLTNFDVFQQAGGQGKALVESIPVTAGSGGVSLVFRSVVLNAMVSAIQLVPAGPPTLPPSPTNLAAVAGDKQVSLSWTASSGAASYSVYRGTAAGGEGAVPIKTGVTGTSYTDTGLTDGTAYYYKVTAVNSAGESTPSNEASATPAAAQAAALQINCGGGDYTSATTGLWQADTDFTGGSTYTFPNPSVAGTADTSLFDSVRYDPTGFLYRLPVPAGSYTLRLHFVEGDRTAAGQRVFNVSVNGSPVLTNFDVFKDAGGQGIADVKSFPVTAGADGVTVNFQAVITNAMVSAIQLIPAGPPTLPPAPSSLAAVAGDKQVSLSWTASSGAASYNVYRGTAAGGEAATPIKTGVTGTTYTDTGLTNGTAYYYKVTAVNTVGESGPSNEASATPTAAAAPTSALQINSGGGDYTSATTGLWQADTDFTGGSAYTFPTAVSGTSDPALFQSVRYDPTTFSYQLPVAAGSYTLNLYFMEGDRTGPGQRVFNVSVNGSQVLSNFDVFQQAGGQGKALVESIPVTVGPSGLNVLFQSVVLNAMVSAIQLVPAGPSSTPSAPATLSATPGNGQVGLVWSNVPIATSYHLYRSTTQGGPYASLATDLTTTSYTDNSVTNGTNYYYVVTAVNGVVESAYSNQAWAMPTAAAAPLVKIMPLGDSITGYATTYRRPLWKLLQGGGYGVDFVGSQVTQPANGEVIDYDPDHEGHPGYRSDQILSLIGQWAGTYRPDIVLLHIGTNDLLQGASISSIVSNMGQTIDQLRTANPNVKVLLAQIIPLSDGSTSVQTLNAQIPGLAAQKTTTQSPVIVVDQFTGYDPSTDSADGIHPNDSGTQKMANKWYAALQTLLGNGTVTPPATAIRINCGGGDYTSASNVVWQTDTDNRGGLAYTFPTTVTGTSDPALYQSVRYSDTSFSYKLPVAAGSYTLRLHFVEGDRTAAGQRVFNVSVNGSPVLTNFDVFKDAGGQGIADVKSFPVTAGADGVTVNFQAVITNAMVSAIEIVPN